MKKELGRGTKKLRPRANIIHILGDELISNDIVAITELVKNAYDADAAEVTVKFEGDIENEEGNTLLEIPATASIVGVILAPWLAALGAIAAIATKCTIKVEKRV